ncbi:MAG TPA: hypothetical protein VLV83_04720 [Acidobacteriota bacterium]|nr:hypothetical protein [Acidobacteriota bacterium]
MNEVQRTQATPGGTDRRVNVLFVIAGLLLIALVYALTTSPPLSAEPPQGTFQEALDRAMSLSTLNVTRHLEALTPENSSLHWDSTDPRSPKVLVATWTSYDGYPRNKEQTCSLARQVWVTPVPQVQGFCRGSRLSGSALEDRLVQYLGLAPGSAYQTVVELWVNPGDIFRPCPDPEIDDRECSPGLPVLSDNPTANDLEHARWFQQQVETYYGDTPLPWTRLGYTYDWASPTRPVGASEYIIRQGAEVFVSSVTPTGDYCSPDANLPRNPAPTGASSVGPC